MFRSKFLSAIFLVLIALSSLPSTQAAKYPPEMDGFETHVYRTVGDVSLNLYLIKPKGWSKDDSRPVTLFFFGGGWKSGNPEQFEPHCRHLANLGFVAITVDYRVATRHGTKAIQCVEDAEAAVRWVRKNSAKLGINPDQVLAGGGSAGGHIAACLGTVTKDPQAQPNALALFNPACVLAKIDGATPWPENRDAELKQRMGTEPSNLSPAHHVSNTSPPCIIFHGKSDTTVPYSTAETFTRKMKEAGVRCELKGYEGVGHGFFNLKRERGKYFELTIKELDHFLKSIEFIQ